MVLVVLFFVLSFFAIAGTYLNINPYDNLIWIKAIVHFIFLTFTMMIIPFCYKRFIKKATVKNGRRICKWNCLIVLSLYFVIDIFLMGGIYDETFQNLGANLVYALMFYYINRKLFYGNSKTIKEPTPTINDNSTEYSLSNPDETITNNTGFQIKGEDIKLITEQDITHTTNISNQENNQKKRYCSHCGNLIDNATKKCCGCGKQYFKGISWNKVLPIVVISILVISLVFNVVLSINNIGFKNDIDELETKISNLQQESNKQSFSEYTFDILKEKSDFIDDFVVFVEDDGSNLFHKYECDQFKGEYFWSYNIDAAKEEGYYPCPKCHN